MTRAPMKRWFDILGAGSLLLLTLPLWLPIAIWVRADSPGPILYRQTRVGQGGRPFGLLKFRSMVADADRIGGYSTAAGDPRITRAGRFLRRSSLDELPQLLNVLRGEMSLVGPRPDVPAQRAGYLAEDWERRHSVRPGITGLAQATRRSTATPQERLALDLAYVARPTLAHDLKILALTVLRLARGGAT